MTVHGQRLDWMSRRKSPVVTVTYLTYTAVLVPKTMCLYQGLLGLYQKKKRSIGHILLRKLGDSYTF